MPRHMLTALLACLALAVWAPPAFANFGTPMIWLTQGGLVVGNLVIAGLEAFLLKRWLGYRLLPTYGVMLAANYFSAVAGWVCFGLLVPPLFRMLGTAIAHPLIGYILVALLMLAYAVSVLLEWPFIRLLGPKEPGHARPALHASVRVHLFSYALLLPYFAMVWGHASLYTRTVLVAPEALPAVAAEIYYLSEDGGLRVMDTWGHHNRTLATPKLKGVPFELSLLASESGKAWDLHVSTREPYGGAIWIPRFMPEVTSDPALEDRLRESGSPTTRWRALDLRPLAAAAWEVQAGTSLSVRRGEVQRTYGVDLAFHPSLPHHVTVLPGDTAVFDLDDREILRFDYVSGRLTVLARGRSPIVVMP